MAVEYQLAHRNSEAVDVSLLADLWVVPVELGSAVGRFQDPKRH